MTPQNTTRKGDAMGAEWRIGDSFYRDGDLAAHTVLAFTEDGLRMLVRREAYSLARAFTYFMDRRGPA